MQFIIDRRNTKWRNRRTHHWSHEALVQLHEQNSRFLTDDRSCCRWNISHCLIEIRAYPCFDVLLNKPLAQTSFCKLPYSSWRARYLFDPDHSKRLIFIDSFECYWFVFLSKFLHTSLFTISGSQPNIMIYSAARLQEFSWQNVLTQLINFVILALTNNWLSFCFVYDGSCVQQLHFVFLHRYCRILDTTFIGVPMAVVCLSA